MTGPRLKLTETALFLIRHAILIPRGGDGPVPVGRIVAGAAESSTRAASWLEETALLRLIAIVEAYVDSASMHRLSRATDASDSLVAKLMQDLELASSSTWQQRKDAYERYHGFSLSSQDGWGAISAGIDVRNCLAHGMGSLTAKQRQSPRLASVVKAIDVSIGGGRMHLGAKTIPRLGDACVNFVSALDRELVSPLR